MKWTPLVLSALLVVVQGDLWLGKGNCGLGGVASPM